MAFEWGYSPKVEKYIPLGDFPADKYLIIAQQALENLGWKLSHLSGSGIIAYTGLSVQSYSEEVSIRIVSNFAIFKSECIGVQLLFTDYGKNQQNLDKFFHEFEYVEYHLKDVWEERLQGFHAHIAGQDDGYLEQAPLKAKDKIKNVLYLFYPQKGYLVTPVIIVLNVLLWLAKTFILTAMLLNFRYRGVTDEPWTADMLMKVNQYFGMNTRQLTLDGQWWRLLGQQFFHFSFSHLFFNMYALVYIGLMIENKLGSLKTLAVYLLSGICGGLLSVYTHDLGFLGGASGAIMGMFGAFLALLLSHAFEKTANKALLISTLILVAYMLISGFIGDRGVDNSAHLGGLVSGFIIGYLLYHKEILGMPVPVRYRLTAVAALIIAFGAVIFKISPQYQVNEYAKLKYDFNVNDTKFNQVYYINRSTPQDERLRVVKECGIEVWENNLKITREMDKLVLLEIDKLDRDYRKAIAKKSYEAALLMYEDCKAESMDKKRRIRQKMTEVSNMKSKLQGIHGENYIVTD